MLSREQDSERKAAGCGFLATCQGKQVLPVCYSESLGPAFHIYMRLGSF